jgi:predicted metal-dependent phosphoesterase TrpH
MAIDLHTHSTASDGTLRPAEVIREAHRLGLRAVAIADHDTTDGLPEAADEAARLGVELVPAVELNTDGADLDLHILGYYIAPERPAFRAALAHARQERLARARSMIARLRERGVEIEEARVLAIAGGAPVCRPHIARALVEAGYARTVPEAFTRFLHRHSPIYVPRTGLTAGEAIRCIRRGGGVPVLAHPGSLPEPVVLALIAEGLCGLEVFYLEHTPEMVVRWGLVARREGLIATGGTDAHGPESSKPHVLGTSGVPDEALEALKAERDRLARACVSA